MYVYVYIYIYIYIRESGLWTHQISLQIADVDFKLSRHCRRWRRGFKPLGKGESGQAAARCGQPAWDRQRRKDPPSEIGNGELRSRETSLGDIWSFSPSGLGYVRWLRGSDPDAALGSSAG